MSDSIAWTSEVDRRDKLMRILYSDSTPAITFTHHFSGRCTESTQGAITRTYSWDKECRITGISETGQTSASYGYNGFDARATRTFGGATTTFKRDGADPVDAVLSDISPGTTARYLPGISEQRNGVSTYFHEGIKNAITQTNASQSVTATKRYDAFGLQVASTGTWKSPFGYGGPWGYQEDGDAYGLKLLGHRYYDPSTGRFLSRDIAKSGGNWYAYCVNDPVGYADPAGELPLIGWLAFLAASAVIVEGCGRNDKADAVGVGIGEQVPMGEPASALEAGPPIIRMKVRQDEKRREERELEEDPYGDESHDSDTFDTDDSTWQHRKVYKHPGLYK
jgi:RHS repeat-associated protein